MLVFPSVDRCGNGHRTYLSRYPRCAVLFHRSRAQPLTLSPIIICPCRPFLRFHALCSVHDLLKVFPNSTFHFFHISVQMRSCHCIPFPHNFPEHWIYLFSSHCHIFLSRVHERNSSLPFPIAISPLFFCWHTIYHSRTICGDIPLSRFGIRGVYHGIHRRFGWAFLAFPIPDAFRYKLHPVPFSFHSSAVLRLETSDRL